jgi:FkbM family methyltransferase
MLRRFAKHALELYATRLPYHRGKWRVVESALRLSGIEEIDRGQTFEVGRAGLRWRLNTECAVQRRLYYHGGFDVHDVRELLARVPAGGVFFDIGSYFGYYSLRAAQRGARVCAFEPDAANFALLAQHIALNSFDQTIRAFPLALSDAPGRARFAGASAENRGTGHLASTDEAGGEVALTTLDAFVAEQGIERLDALKLDVEGAECRVLAGGEETLRRFRPALLVELNPPCLERAGASELALLGRLSDLGYRCWRATAHGLVPFTERTAEYLNLICLPNR